MEGGAHSWEPAETVSEETLGLATDGSAPGSCTRLADLTLAIAWRSPAYLAALERIRRFARSTQAVLLQGESGAGKTSFAEIAHRLGRRPDDPFVVVNCASLPEPLLESELFGHVKGAFTGADTERAGLLRAAGSGTIFLDEIDKASRSLQGALLHVLDRREIRAVGSHEARPVACRLVFATNRNLGSLSARGEFLPDLRYRIGGISVRIPPVRERPEDFDLLLALALRELRAEEGIQGITVRPEGRDLLSSYHWPGNVRELFSVVRAAALLLDGRRDVGVPELEAAAQASPLESHAFRIRSGVTLAERLRDFERDELLLALRLEGGNQTRAAARLGLSRRGLNKKLHRHALLDQLERERLRGFRSRRKRDGHPPTAEIPPRSPRNARTCRSDTTNPR